MSFGGSRLGTRHRNAGTRRPAAARNHDVNGACGRDFEKYAECCLRLSNDFCKDDEDAYQQNDVQVPLQIGQQDRSHRDHQRYRSPRSRAPPKSRLGTRACFPGRQPDDARCGAGLGARAAQKRQADRSVIRIRRGSFVHASPSSAGAVAPPPVGGTRSRHCCNRAATMARTSLSGRLST